MPFPSFFIVGAPRCGTTALSKYLKKNPDVGFAKPKETHYFSKLCSEGAGDIERDYLAPFFYRCHPGQSAIGEGSTSYLYSEEAIRQIDALNPEARFIAMVRSPLELLPSYHQLMLYLLEEDEEDFERAWALEPDRLSGVVPFPRRNIDPRALRYRDIGSVGQHTRALIEHVGDDRCLVILFEDFKRDPSLVYRRALQFIGAKDDGRDEFPAFRTSRHYRSRLAHEALFKGPKRAGSLRKLVALKAEDGRRKKPRPLKSLYRRVIALNTVHRSPRPLSAGTRAMLSEYFAEDVAVLGDTVGRDLSHWLR